MVDFLIVGDSSFLGLKIFNTLVSMGFKVGVYDKVFNRNLDYTKSAGFVVGELNNDYSLRAAVSSMLPKCLIFSAPKLIAPSGEYYYLQDYHYTINSAHAICSILDSFNIEQLVFRSSFEVYGITSFPGKTPIPENTPLNPVSYRGSALKSCEDIFRVHCFNKSIKFTSFRVFELLGSDFSEALSGVVQTVVESMKRGDDIGVYGSGCWRDFIDTDAAAAAIISGVLSNIQGPVNIGTSKAFKIKSIIHKIKKALNSKSCIINIPDARLPSVSAVANISKISSVFSMPVLDIDRSINTMIESVLV